MMRLSACLEVMKSVPGVVRIANLKGIRVVKGLLSDAVLNFDIPRLPDRKYFRGEIIPRICTLEAQTLLFVGCRKYCAGYCRRWSDAGVDCWTIDIDPQAARWGLEGKHVVGDVLECEKLFSSMKFDVVIMNGVFGFGIDDVDGIERALKSVDGIMSARGLLVVGWNTDVIADCSQLPALTEHFERNPELPFPPRVTFSHSTHVYDFYSRRPGGAVEAELPTRVAAR